MCLHRQGALIMEFVDTIITKWVLCAVLATVLTLIQTPVAQAFHMLQVPEKQAYNPHLSCAPCCETRTHGNLVIRAEIINECEISSTPMMSSTTPMVSSSSSIPVSTTETPEQGTTTEQTTTDAYSSSTELYSSSSHLPFTSQESSIAQTTEERTTTEQIKTEAFTSSTEIITSTSHLPSSTTEEYCEPCCDTRSIGHMIVLADVIRDRPVVTGCSGIW